MQLHLIPDRQHLPDSIALAKQYHAGFEFHDFSVPELLDNPVRLTQVIADYLHADLPSSLGLHGAYLDLAPHSIDSRIRAVSDYRITQCLDIAERLHVQYVVFHTNFISNFRLESYRNQWVSDNASYWTRKLEAYPNLSICIENMSDSDPILMARLAEAMRNNPQFSLCFDYAHAVLYGGNPDPEYWVQMLSTNVTHLHINDNDGVSDLHLPVGDGAIDWNRFAEHFQNSFRTAALLVEVFGVEAQKKSLQFLTDSLHLLNAPQP